MLHSETLNIERGSKSSGLSSLLVVELSIVGGDVAMVAWVVSKSAFELSLIGVVCVTATGVEVKSLVDVVDGFGCSAPATVMGSCWPLVCASGATVDSNEVPSLDPTSIVLDWPLLAVDEYIICPDSVDLEISDSLACVLLMLGVDCWVVTVTGSAGLELDSCRDSVVVVAGEELACWKKIRLGSLDAISLVEVGNVFINEPSRLRPLLSGLDSVVGLTGALSKEFPETSVGWKCSTLPLGRHEPTVGASPEVCDTARGTRPG